MSEKRSDKWEALLTSRKVWFAAFGLALALAKWAGLEIPTEVLIAAETLIIVLIASIALEDHGLRASGR